MNIVNDEIIDEIFFLLDYKSRLNISYTNSEFYKKYKDSIKYKIFKYINTDYELFFDCMNRYKYNQKEKEDMLIEAINNINILWGTTITGYYDLRYIFELIYSKMNTETIPFNNSVKHNQLKLMIKTIKKCISFNRFETMMNVRNEPILHSLQYNFKK